MKAVQAARPPMIDTGGRKEESGPEEQPETMERGPKVHPVFQSPHTQGEMPIARMVQIVIGIIPHGRKVRPASQRSLVPEGILLRIVIGVIARTIVTPNKSHSGKPGKHRSFNPE